MVKFGAVEALSLQEKSLVGEVWWFGKNDKVLGVLNSNFSEVQSRVDSPNQNSVQISVCVTKKRRESGVG